MPVFFVCAGLLGLLAVSLTVSVGRLRMQKKIYLGDGGDPEMLAAIRAHGNFMEYVPLCLALIYFASDYYGYWPVAIISLVLLISRVLHAGGLLGFIPLGRTMGAAGTTIILAASSAMCVYAGFTLKQY
ncbi:MAG TPA: MAPEG family protein [Reyranella sp.]